ncbi:hypothetical protein COV04_03810 [Candidatus Uhrbacteria bacterium CG10_big_fil_rev_8_21_14_0_10_48_11]|uniref:DoxX family protein n=1 Tax=Candidatus Uhrbacteria bacterium CG10_big_fil_rev_8_21_14_0_10_48_11 TaxID=1975037 RepID=A0A2M8LE43_9BACT|nr:MAG: hypothetical protein COV04_03810 [Candidatus Uhrbacteria bacterium CG10_big_fil_rev_8_21_14_0_10_48_11]
MKTFFKIFSTVLFFCLPFLASAHEVYVLGDEAIAHDSVNSSTNPFMAIASSESQFAFWAFLGIVLVLLVLIISLSRWAERLLDPLLFKLKPYAPAIERVTIGASFLASAYYGALFGPELPLSSIVGGVLVLRIVLVVIGVLFIFGIGKRVAAVVALIIFADATLQYGFYMLTYLGYLGAALMPLILGRAALVKKEQALASFVLRVLFGFSLLYASFYAKFLHSSLALATVTRYHLTNYFHFEPLFLVLGAMIVEMLLGFFYIMGFEIRFTSILFIGFIGVSIAFFGEAVWPHIILFGTALALFVHGYDHFSIEGRFLKKGIEPVL